MKLEVFKNWCAQQGIQSVLDVRVRNGNERFAILAQDVAENDILSVPLNGCMTGKTSEELADRLLFEKNQEANSHWSAYLDVLPSIQDMQDMPRFWNPERFEKVTDGGFLHQEYQEYLKRQSKVNDDSGWALACVDSRSNFLPDGASSFYYSLTPLLDMINHNATVGTRMRIDPDTNIATLSVDYIEEPSALPFASWMSLWNSDGASSTTREVKISYGELTNLETLSNYGFVEQDNVFNQECVSVRLMNQPQPMTVLVESDGTIESTAIKLLRSFLVNREEMELLGARDELGVLSPFVSERNEMEVYALVGGYLEEAYLEAKVGSEASGKDPLVSRYLGERAKTLRRAMDRITTRYPGLLG